MIKGIADLDYNDAKRLLSEILDRTKNEEELLRRESEDKKLDILMYEYRKRLNGGAEQAGCEKAIEECNTRMLEIEQELFALVNRKNYFELQLERLDSRA